jgi:hypothetical protein
VKSKSRPAGGGYAANYRYLAVSGEVLADHITHPSCKATASRMPFPRACQRVRWERGAQVRLSFFLPSTGSLRQSAPRSKLWCSIKQAPDRIGENLPAIVKAPLVLQMKPAKRRILMAFRTG